MTDQELQDQLDAARKAESQAIQERDNFTRLQDEVQSKLAAIAERETDVLAREQTASAREERVALRESAASTKEAELKERDAAVAKAEGDRQQAHREHVTKLNQMSAETEASLGTLRVELEEQRQEIGRRLEEVSGRETAIADRETSAAAREEQLARGFARLEAEKASYKEEIRAQLAESLKQ